MTIPPFYCCRSVTRLNAAYSIADRRLGLVIETSLRRCKTRGVQGKAQEELPRISGCLAEGRILDPLHPERNWEELRSWEIPPLVSLNILCLGRIGCAFSIT